MPGEAPQAVTREELERQHRTPPLRSTPREREDAEQSPLRNYVRDLVLGFNDGLVSVYAVVAGVVGAGFGSGQVVMAGVAATVAGALSMGIGEYISTKSQAEYYASERAMERRHIQDYPELETAELREYLEEKGIEGEALDQVVARITADPEKFLEVMMVEEFGHSPKTDRSPLYASGMIMLAFVVAAALPVVPFFAMDVGRGLWAASVLSLLGLLGAGAVKAWVSGLKPWRSAFEMAALGIAAALITYGIGSLVGRAV